MIGLPVLPRVDDSLRLFESLVGPKIILRRLLYVLCVDLMKGNSYGSRHVSLGKLRHWYTTLYDVFLCRLNPFNMSTSIPSTDDSASRQGSIPCFVPTPRYTVTI